MISRYESSVITNIWSLKTKYQYFLTVEKSLTQILENKNIIPQGVSKSLKDVSINLEVIEEIERSVKHDVIAFTTSITNQMDKKYQAYFHYGVTSSDIIDTAMMLQMKDSCKEISESLHCVIDSLENQISNSQNILGLGRSHGIYAEPMIFAQKWLGHLAEFKRRLNDLNKFEFSGQFSGAVGNYTLLSTDVEKEALAILGLSVEKVSTQVIPRDRIASLVQIFSLLGSAIERLAIEVRHLHHSDIDEVCEGFSVNQKGSSTMPHKKNPISSENLSGLARMLRSYSQIALDNCLLWHERDISHSSSERMYLPDMFGIAKYSLDRLSSTLDNLTYNQDNIERKVLENPLVFSSYILHELISKTQSPREELYKIVQDACFSCKTLDEIKNFVELKSKVTLEELNLPALKEKYSREFRNVYLRLKD
jgi:adenylosuccinate lyase